MGGNGLTSKDRGPVKVKIDQKQGTLLLYKLGSHQF